MRTALIIIGGILFLAGAAGYIAARILLQPKLDEDIYWEFEDDDPQLVRYQYVSRLTFAAAAAGALLVFIASSM